MRSVWHEKENTQMELNIHIIRHFIEVLKIFQDVNSKYFIRYVYYHDFKLKYTMISSLAMQRLAVT